MTEKANRTPTVSVDPQFIERWSPRAFSSEPLPEKELLRVFEAARWAPSCNNGQPWLFLYASTDKDLKTFRSLLVEGNQVWANKAPVLVFLLGAKQFAHNGKPNRHGGFDSGAAWMSLALQAKQMGWITHAMAGFHLERAYEVLKVSPEKYEIYCAIAVGKPGNSSELPDHLKEREHPSDRKPLSEVARAGEFSRISD